MKRLLQKLTNKMGFTLAETLMAILILLLVASVITAGIPAAVNAYTKAIDAANAQTLLSTTVSALRSELSVAGDVKTVGSSIYYWSSKTGTWAKLYNDSDKHTIMVQDYILQVSDGTSLHPDVVQLVSGEAVEPRELVSEVSRKMTKRASTGKNDYFRLTFQVQNSPVDDIITFPEVTVKKSDDTELAFVRPFSIRLLAPNFHVPEVPT